MAQLFVTITAPPAASPVNRTFDLLGNITWSQVPSGWSLVSKSVRVQYGAGGTNAVATFPVGLNWRSTGTVSNATPWGAFVTLTVTASATFRFLLTNGEPDFQTLTVTTTYVVRLTGAISPTVSLSPFTSPIVAATLPVDFMFVGSATSPQAPIVLVQYKVEGGQFANAVNVTGNWSQFQIRLPLPPTAADQDHTLTIRATDSFGTIGEMSQSFKVEAQPPIVFPPGAKTTFSGAPTTSSITSWTRLEPQCTDADMGTSSSARLFDPLWLLTRQWQLGEFQAEDAGTPIQARVRATSALLSRRFNGEVPQPAAGAGPTTVAAAPYDPAAIPLEVLVERRPMRAADASDARMLTFAVESGLHFLRMLELQALSKSYRAAFLAKLALQPLPPAKAALVDDATARYLQSMVGRAPDGRPLATLLRTVGPAQLVLDSGLNIALADRPKVQQAATAWLAWYDSMCSEPAASTDDAWNAPRLEYALSVGARFSGNAGDEVAFSASEVDGPIDWSSFDVNTQVSLTTLADRSVSSIVEATIPAPVTFPGAPAPRFWEMEDARIAYGLVAVGPPDIAHLMAIEYASSYGNDWFVVPLTLPIGSVTRVDSLVITDTFGVRSLIRPIGDPALPPPFFSLWQQSLRNPAASGPQVATNQFFLPPTLSRSLDSAPLEDVLFMRDEMANLAWAIERTIESPIEQPAQRYEAPDAAASDLIPVTSAALPRYLLSSEVPPNWIPLLPVQIPNPAQPSVTSQALSRLKRGAVLQPDGTGKVHVATGDVLLSLSNLLLYDEEVLREGARLTRQRRLARWTDGSTWLWTAFRNQVGQGEGASNLRFDQLLEPAGTRGE
jgi:hypothetical protein